MIRRTVLSILACLSICVLIGTALGDSGRAWAKSKAAALSELKVLKALNNLRNERAVDLAKLITHRDLVAKDPRLALDARQRAFELMLVDDDIERKTGLLNDLDTRIKAIAGEKTSK